MRTAVGVTIGAVIAWCILAIWHGPVAWAFTRVEPATPTDHVDRMRTWHHGIEGPATWPTEGTP